MVAVYPEFLRPSATSDLVRIGADYDGGYVLPKRVLSASNGLLSFGLSDEFEFEREFAEKAEVQVVCFDHTVGSQFWMRRALSCLFRGIVFADGRRIRRAFRYIDYRSFFDGQKARHIRKAIGFPGQGAVSLSQAMEHAGLKDSLFLKIDIEGWEYRLFSDIVRSRSSFCGLAIELHDLDLHEDRVERFLKDMSDEFVLVHFHPNTHTQVGPDGYALAVELTLMNRALLKVGENLSYRRLPLDGLDMPNLPGDSHVELEFGVGASILS